MISSGALTPDVVASQRSQHSILVVDDDRRIVKMVDRMLAHAGYCVNTAFDGREALRLAHQMRPDVVVLDIMLPDIDGLDVCRRLRDQSAVPVLMLTARDEVDDRVKGLDSGADDYLVKPFATAELLARLRALLRRQTMTDPGLELRYLDLTLNTSTRQAQRGERDIELTTTEFEMLRLFLGHPCQVLTRNLIMERVWGYDYEAESNVLEVYVRYLRGKLEAGGEQRLIHTVRGAGYVLRA